MNTEKERKVNKKQLDESISLLEHLDELRRRLIYSAIAVVLGAAAAYPCVTVVLEYITRPVGKLVFISPVEAFWARVKVTFFLGIFVSLPFVLYQIWRFIQRGLLAREKRFVLPVTCLSFALFCLGGGFGYLVIFPIGMKFLLSYGTQTLIPMISVSPYLSFLFCVIFSFGLVFELPLAIGFLARVGILKSQTLREKRKFAVLAIFVVAAILTPPDVFTQLLMAGPLLVLYEVSVCVARLIERRK